jgi:hypothetical protein
MRGPRRFAGCDPLPNTSTDTNGIYRTVYQQHWWLEAVTGGDFHEATVRTGNVTQAWLPYVTRRRWGYLVSGMPFLTHSLGPVIVPGAGSPTSEFLRHNSLTHDLLGQLPKLAHFRQVLSPGDASPLGFAEYGCHIGLQFTFITTCTDLEAVWKNMRDKARNLIRRSEEKNTVRADAEPAEFVQIYAEHCRERGQVNHYGDPRVEQILARAIERDQGRIYLCRNRATGATTAGIVVVWDSHYMYYLMSSRALAADGGAVSLLLWNAMQEAQRRGVNFDFDGVNNIGAYRFMSGFGGTLARRHIVEKFNTVYHVLDKLRARLYGQWENPYGA